MKIGEILNYNPNISDYELKNLIGQNMNFSPHHGQNKLPKTNLKKKT